MLIPPTLRVCHAISLLLEEAYKSEDLVPLHGAVALFTASYNLVPPRIQLVRMSDLGSGILGRCSTGGKLIQLVRPSLWKKHGTGGWKKWARVVLHECAHFVMLHHGEEHADLAEKWLVEKT